MKTKIMSKGFFWKPYENYLNAIMVLVLVILDTGVDKQQRI